jgi:hypothetical protein
MLLAAAAADEPVKSAQAARPKLSLGSRVRVFESGGGQAVEGTLSALKDGRLTLSLDTNGERILVDLGQGTRVEIRTRQSSRRKGAVIGAAAGALGLLAVVAATNGCGNGTPESEFAQDLTGISDGECYAGALLLGGAAGALVGVAVSHGERWEAVPPDAHRGVVLAGTGVRWRLALRPRALGVSVSLGF